MNSPPLSEDDLISLANQHGFSVTARQIKRWRQAGILPLPKQVHPDFGVTYTEYPPETANHLLAVCRFLKADRRLNRVAMMLFFEGFAIPLPALNEAIDSLFFRRMNQRKEVNSIREIAEDATYLLSQRQNSASMKQMRKRMGSSEQFKTLIMSGFMLLLDPSLDLGKSEREQAKMGNLITKALNLRRASTDRFGDAEPWFHGQLGTELKEMKENGFLSFDAMYATLRTATIEELAQARADMEFLRLLKDAAQKFQMLFGEGALGLTFFAELEANGVEDKTVLLLLMLYGRKTGFGMAIDNLKETLSRLCQYLLYHPHKSA